MIRELTGREDQRVRRIFRQAECRAETYHSDPLNILTGLDLHDVVGMIIYYVMRYYFRKSTKWLN